MVDTSIIVPCYNEYERANKFLEDLIDFCCNNIKNYEILLIDDGSTDRTYDLLKNLCSKKNVHLLKNDVNLGKGATVRKGVLNSRGKNIIFIDADGSTSADQIPLILMNLERNNIVIGDRYSKRSKVLQPVTRYILGSIFNIYVNQIFNIHINDCLCGFKGFKREVAIDLFSNLIEKRWLFDVEILYKSRINNYSIKTIPIEWKYSKGTKISVFDPFKFFIQLIELRIKLDRQPSLSK